MPDPRHLPALCRHVKKPDPLRGDPSNVGPAAAEGAVNRDPVLQQRQLHLHQRLLRREQRALGVELVERAGHAVGEQQVRQLVARGLGVGLGLLRRKLVDQGRAAGAGLCAGVTSGLVRPVLHGLHRGPLEAGVVVAGITVLVLPIIGVLLLQTAYRDGGLDAGLATQTTVDPVVAGVIGIVVLDERFGGGVVGSGLAVLCAVVTVLGLVALIRAGPTPPHPAG